MFSFHLSLPVRDLDQTKPFYLDALGATQAPGSGHWFNIFLYEHQLTFHQAAADKIIHPIDHFGFILSKPAWQTLVKKLSDQEVEYVVLPEISNSNTDTEYGKTLILDPDKNIIEFKYYLDYENTV